MPKKSSVKPTGWSLKQLFESFDDPKIDQTFADLAKKSHSSRAIAMS